MTLHVIQILVFLIGFRSPSPDLPAYRKMMEQSVIDDAAAGQFYQKCKSIGEDSAPIFLGFRAMSEFMMCNHIFNPVTKWSHFKKGKKMLEDAISRSGGNAELRFLRFTVQSQVPGILNYNASLREDKLILFDYLKKGPLDKDLYYRIKAYLLETKYCSTMEKELLKTL
jgi:hypothetical protein